LKIFVNDPLSVQLVFLINHESTNYKLAKNIYDLTQVQIHFHYLVAKKASDAIDAALKNNNNSTTTNQYRIEGNESPEVIKEKLSMIKQQARGY